MDPAQAQWITLHKPWRKTYYVLGELGGQWRLVLSRALGEQGALQGCPSTMATKNQPPSLENPTGQPYWVKLQYFQNLLPGFSASPYSRCFQGVERSSPSPYEQVITSASEGI